MPSRGAREHAASRIRLPDTGEFLPKGGSTSRLTVCRPEIDIQSNHSLSSHIVIRGVAELVDQRGAEGTVQHGKETVTLQTKPLHTMNHHRKLNDEAEVSYGRRS